MYPSPKQQVKSKDYELKNRKPEKPENPRRCPCGKGGEDLACASCGTRFHSQCFSSTQEEVDQAQLYCSVCSCHRCLRPYFPGTSLCKTLGCVPPLQCLPAEPTVERRGPGYFTSVVEVDYAIEELGSPDFVPDERSLLWKNDAMVSAVKRLYQDHGLVRVVRFRGISAEVFYLGADGTKYLKKKDMVVVSTAILMEARVLFLGHPFEVVEWAESCHVVTVKCILIERRRKFMLESALDTMADDLFVDWFRLSKADYIKLLKMVYKYVTGEPTYDSWDYAMKVTLLVMGNRNSLRNSALRVGLGITSLKKTVFKTANAMLQATRYYFKYPLTTKEIRQTAQGFLERRGLRHVMGIIDSILLECVPPLGDDKADYEFYYCKRHAKFTIASDVDQLVQFAQVGDYSTAHDGELFNNTKLMQNFLKGRGNLPAPRRLPGAAEDAPLIYLHYIADKGYTQSFALLTKANDDPPGLAEHFKPRSDIVEGTLAHIVVDFPGLKAGHRLDLLQAMFTLACNLNNFKRRHVHKYTVPEEAKSEIGPVEVNVKNIKIELAKPWVKDNEYSY